ncbi:putative RING/U-box superfamily protein [Melia azedarach]|uniref:RING/U-box superfamily protein n=1 Tax=Melia azedarach TaxID=155640 RepID=A0ACC1XPB6_MELAZ|nr:putative RING/U-box superfamily protein [Melia azedarach]
MEYEDFCEVWPENPKEESQESLTSQMFSLVFHLSFIHLPRDLIEDDEDGLLDINDLTETAVDDQIFELERTRLIDTNTSKQTLESILSSMHVPSRPFFVEKILNCAKEMMNDKAYGNHRALRMHVRMSVVVDEEEQEDEEEEMDSYEDEEETKTVGLSKSAIEKLGVVEIADDDQKIRKERCTICLEEFPVDLRVTRMPCSHVFHSNCIFNWLYKSKFCPLCRFEIN